MVSLVSPRQKYSFFAVLILILITLLIYNSTIKRKEQFLKVIERANISKLFNLDFNYIIANRETCQQIEALILVTSYFGDVETRSAMRRAFSTEDLEKMGFRRLFLLGVSPKDKYTNQKAIEDESRRFKDIIQGNFIEAYRNLTYKHAMGLKWASDNCNRAKFIIKMDDDIVVNIRKLPGLLGSLKMHDLFIAGYVLNNMIPIREPHNKWYVTSEEYEPSIYPPFVSGWFYITTPKTCASLLALTTTTKYFWIDDTLITGILAQELHIHLQNIHEYFTENSEFLQCCLNDFKTKNLSCDIIVGPNGGDNNLFYDFNVAMGRCETNGCGKRARPLNQTCVAKMKVHLTRGDAVVEKYKLRK